MSKERTVAVFVKLSFGEVYASSVRATLRQFRLILLIAGTMTGVWGLLLVLVVFHPRPGADWYETIRQTAAFPWLIAGACIVVLILPLLSAQKLTRDPRIAGGCRYLFSESGMQFENSSTKAEVNWTGFLTAEESGASFLLFTSKIAAHVLPKRCLASEEDIATLRELLRAHLPNARVRPPD